MEGIISDVDTVRQRLTPAHIGLFSYVPKKPATSFDKAKTQYSKDKGTHCVAKQTIGRGDILIREQPFIRQLDRDHLKDHCSWCFAHFDLVYMDDLYFCRNEEDCNWFAQYCSPRCEQASWNAGHCIMCRFPELEWLDRNTLFALTGYIASLSHGQDKIPGLVSNMELETESRINKLKQQFKMVAELFYLNDKAIEKLVEIYLQIKCNTFTVKAIEDLEDYGYVVSRDYTNLGKAVYLSASKLNHSCDPNALVSFGEVQNVCELKIQCIKGPVKEGQEVTISYGPLATKMKKEERRKLLKDNYYFDCQCSACDETNENSPDKIYKCQICKSGKLYRQQTACNECGQEPHWPFFLKTENQAEEYKLKQDYVKVLELQEKIYHANTLPLGETADKLAQIYCAEGRWGTAVNYSRKSLKVAETIYGKLSVEVAEEMMKLSTILFNAKQKPDSIKQIQATLILYRILGLDKTAPEDVDELQAMQTHLIFMFR